MVLYSESEPMASFNPEGFFSHTYASSMEKDRIQTSVWYPPILQLLNGGGVKMFLVDCALSKILLSRHDLFTICYKEAWMEHFCLAFRPAYM